MSREWISSKCWFFLLLTSATIERYISVTFPLKVKSWNLHNKTKILLVGHCMATFGLSSYSFLCYNIIPLDIKRCLPALKNDQFCYVSEIIINSVVSNKGCTLMIFIFTILTSIKLLKMKRRRSEEGRESTKEFNITVMLVTVATLFLILRTPEIILFQTVNYFIKKQPDWSCVRQCCNSISILYNICNSKSLHQFSRLYDINHSINFLVYMIFFRQFRNTFLSFFICIKLKCLESTESD